MFDATGGVWLAASVRAPENPAFCKAGSDHPSAKAFPDRSRGRGIWPCSIRRRRSTRFVDTCFGTHHPQFGYDANDTLWTSGGGPVLGWLNTKHVPADRRRGEVAGLDGVRARHERQRQARRATSSPNDPVDPAKDKRVVTPVYAIMPSPVDGSIWGAVMGNPGAVVRVDARIESAGDGAHRDLQRAAARLRRARRATSTATASSGCRSRADISAASIAASARGR